MDGFLARIPHRPYVDHENPKVKQRVFPHNKVPWAFYIHEKVAKKFWKNSHKFITFVKRKYTLIE